MGQPIHLVSCDHVAVSGNGPGGRRWLPFCSEVTHEDRSSDATELGPTLTRLNLLLGLFSCELVARWGGKAGS